MKSLLRKTLILAVAVFFPFMAGKAQQSVSSAMNWTPELQMKVKTMGSLSVSPDGKQIAFTAADAVMTSDRSETVTQIYLGNEDGRSSFQITFGDKSSGNPKWSPDGKSIAFTSTRKDNRNNLYLLRLESGGEAEPLTELKGSVIDYDWSPDGKSIAFLMTDAKSEDEEKNDRGRNDYRWIDENLKMARLYVLPLEKGANGKREPRKLTNENYSAGGFDWSPDGTRIVFSHAKSSAVDDFTTSDVSLVEVATQKITPLLKSELAEYSPTFSPDGKQIALIIEDDLQNWASSTSINIIPATGGEPRKFAASFNNQPTVLGWSRDGRQIYFTEIKRTATGIYALDIGSNRISEISRRDDEVYQNVALDRSASTLGFVMQKSDRAPEAYVAKIDNFAPVQVSRVNADFGKVPTGKTELVKWKSTDGTEIEGLLTYPVGYQAGQKVPLILNIHGGPASVFQQVYTGARFVYPFASFAARGYAILRPNPRGSGGYGAKFRRANIKDWGVGDYQDLMTGVDKVIEMGVADPDRLGVSGWSYGGYMTSWIITQTKRFKAASAGAPVTNLVSFVGTADVTELVPAYFGGQPWDNIEIYQKHSPMFNVKGVTTPTLIQHGEADPRVPVSQGYELYNALKKQKVPVRMLVLPRQPHGPNEPKMVLAVMQSNIEWFEKYLK